MVDAHWRLGHDFRIIVQVTVWKADDLLTLPVSALFRTGESWAVFAVRDGRARTTPIEDGQRNNRVALVTSGLSQGDQVVLHPSDRVKDGVAIAEREGR
jgi:HlyD family secretion protein